MIADTNEDDDFDLWRLPRVIETSGLSKTEIYRRMGESNPKQNPFPRNYSYRGNSQAKFWRSDEVRAWKRREAGVDCLAGLLG